MYGLVRLPQKINELHSYAFNVINPHLLRTPRLMELMFGRTIKERNVRGDYETQTSTRR